MSHDATTAVIELREVNLDRGHRTDTDMQAVNLRLERGTIALIETAVFAPVLPLTDAMLGLTPPASGRIFFGGRDWQEMDADESCAARGSIGCVFSGTAWVSNLNADENVLLAARHHGRIPPETARDRAAALARGLGLDGLPAARPAWVDRHVLQKAQLVRALAGDPVLIILEDLTDHESDADADLMIRTVQDAVAGGVAAVWMTRDARVYDNASISAAVRYKMDGLKLMVKS